MTEATRILNDILASNTQHQYMMLGRFQSDCKYFLGNGGRHIKHLYTQNVNDHIEVMKGLYNHLDQKPEWITMEEILSYEAQMTA